MTGPEGADNSIKFVDVLGLRSLFPLFMKTPKKTKRSGTFIRNFLRRTKLGLIFFIVIYCIEKKVDKVDAQFVTLAGTHHKF